MKICQPEIIELVTADGCKKKIKRAVGPLPYIWYTPVIRQTRYVSDVPHEPAVLRREYWLSHYRQYPKTGTIVAVYQEIIS